MRGTPVVSESADTSVFLDGLGERRVAVEPSGELVQILHLPDAAMALPEFEFALRERVGLDTRKSVVLYDQNFVFNFALDGLPNERVMRALYDWTPVRYWSRGV